MRTLIVALLATAILVVGGTPAAAQTPVASPTLADIDALCATVLADATPVAASPAPALDLTVIDPDQIVLDALFPALTTATTMARVIAVRSFHPPLAVLATGIGPLQDEWLAQAQSILDQFYPGAKVLSDAQIAEAYAITTSTSPGMGGASGLEPLRSGHQQMSVRDLCAESLEPDLVFIDHVVAQYSGLLVLTGFAIERGVHPETVALATAIQDEISAQLDQFDL